MPYHPAVLTFEFGIHVHVHYGGDRIVTVYVLFMSLVSVMNQKKGVPLAGKPIQSEYFDVWDSSDLCTVFKLGFMIF